MSVGVPFLCLFMVGYFYVGLTTWFGHRLSKTSTELPEELLAVPMVDVTSDPLRRRDAPGHRSPRVAPAPRETGAVGLSKAEHRTPAE